MARPSCGRSRPEVPSDPQPMREGICRARLHTHLHGRARFGVRVVQGASLPLL